MTSKMKLFFFLISLSASLALSLNAATHPSKLDSIPSVTSWDMVTTPSHSPLSLHQHHMIIPSIASSVDAEKSLDLGKTQLDASETKQEKIENDVTNPYIDEKKDITPTITNDQSDMSLQLKPEKELTETSHQECDQKIANKEIPAKIVQEKKNLFLRCVLKISNFFLQPQIVFNFLKDNVYYFTTQKIKFYINIAKEYFFIKPVTLL